MAGTTVRIRINERELYEAVRVAALRQIIKPTLLNAMQIARAAAPRDTGAYASSFDIVMLQWAGILKNTDPAASYIEFGTKDTPKHRVLGRAADALKI